MHAPDCGIPGTEVLPTSYYGTLSALIPTPSHCLTLSPYSEDTRASQQREMFPLSLPFNLQFVRHP